MAGPEHFDDVARTYGHARPPYPTSLFERLAQGRIIGDGVRVLEIGAGTGQATTDLVKAGCHITAVEPGGRLATQLAAAVPGATVVNARLEDMTLPVAEFDSVVAATAMHWVDLPTVLPRLRETLVPGGRLAVWRTIFDDPRARTPFRDAVSRIIARRPVLATPRDPLDPPPTVRELEAGGWFSHEHTWTHAWDIDLTPEQVHRLFRTFSDWNDDELALLAKTTPAFGPSIREHYVTHLHVLRRT